MSKSEAEQFRDELAEKNPGCRIELEIHMSSCEPTSFHVWCFDEHNILQGYVDAPTLPELRANVADAMEEGVGG